VAVMSRLLRKEEELTMRDEIDIMVGRMDLEQAPRIEEED